MSNAEQMLKKNTKKCNLTLRRGHSLESNMKVILPQIVHLTSELETPEACLPPISSPASPVRSRPPTPAPDSGLSTFEDHHEQKDTLEPIAQMKCHLDSLHPMATTSPGLLYLETVRNETTCVY